MAAGASVQELEVVRQGTQCTLGHVNSSKFEHSIFGTIFFLHIFFKSRRKK